MAQQQAQPRRASSLQEGNRWVWAQPDPGDFTKWFAENVHLHEGMEHDRYVQGVVLIGSKEKRKVTLVNQAGATMIQDEERLVFTPYAKVETRVAYFYDLMAKHPEWLGQIRPVPVEKLREPGVFNVNLPPGFFRLPVAKENNQRVDFLGCVKEVRILDRDTVEWVEVVHTEFDQDGNIVRQTKRRELDGVPIAEYSPGTKVVATLGRYGEDPFAPMKAETGAAGRALGFAGMLVIPGSGIATAEDMQEAQAGAQGVALEGLSLDGPDDAGAAGTPEDGSKSGPQSADPLGDEIKTALDELQADFPETLEEIQAWAREKKLRLDGLTDAQKRGAHRKVTQALERAKAAQAERE